MNHANERQVDGDHYKAEYQHWDWVLNCDLGYLEAQATRYLQRWDKKGSPRKDLEKANHYAQKLIESVYRSRNPRRGQAFIHRETERFCQANGLQGYTQWAIHAIAQWNTVDDLETARTHIGSLLHDLEVDAAADRHVQNAAQAMGWKDGAVPATDSNKHAEQELRLVVAFEVAGYRGIFSTHEKAVARAKQLGASPHNVHRLVLDEYEPDESRGKK
jgi:hypothetical protein